MLNSAATATRRSAARFLSARVVALRAELSETQRLPMVPGRRTQIAALRRDLVQLECRLAEVL